jgi:hypothetical protein
MRITFARSGWHSADQPPNKRMKLAAPLRRRVRPRTPGLPCVTCSIWPLDREKWRISFDTMRWLMWLGILPADQEAPLELREPECWRVEGTKDAATFFRSLVQLISPGAVLYLEGSTEKRVPAFLESRLLPDHPPVKLGTILPASDRYHVAATRENLEALAALIEGARIVYPAIHTHVYRGDQVLVEWYDAFSNDPIYLSASIPEAAVAGFGRAIGRPYSWAKRA